MKKGYGRLRFLIQGALTFVSIAALVILRRYVFLASDVAGLYRYTDVILAVIVICFSLIFVTQVLCAKKDSLIQRRERDEDLLSLKTKAQTDALTGLLNREAAMEQIADFLKAEALQCHTLLLVDLDNFKSINDSFGHFEGDKVLKILSAKIRSVFRNIDIVGRLGGDEFIVLMKYTITTSDIRKKAAELKSALEYVATGGNISVTVTGSVGISTYDGDRKTVETLYKEADEALYSAKLLGKNKYCFFEEPGDETLADDSIGKNRTALTESSAFIQLQALIDNIDGGIALLEIGDVIRAVFLSQSYIKLMHISYSLIKQADNRVLDFIEPEDVTQVEEVLRQGTLSGSSVEAVFRRMTEDGETKWYHIRAVHIQYEDSDKPVLLAIVTDVTNLKTAALNFQAQKKQLETVLRISRVITFEVDIARRTLLVSDPTVAKYGIDVHSIENMPEVLIEAGAIHPDSIDECRRMYNEIYAGVPEGSAIIRTLKRDGQFTIERFTYFTVFDESGRPVKAVGVDEGMETRSETRLRVDLIERQFRNYSDNMLTVAKVIVAADSFEFLKPEVISEQWNNPVTTYTELLDYLVWQIDEPDERQEIEKSFSSESLKRDFAEGLVVSRAYRVSASDGSVKWHNMTASMYVDQFDGNDYTFVRTRDITFKKNLEQSLKEKIIHDPNISLYSFENFGKLSEAYIQSAQRKMNCAVVLLAIKNYDDLREQYGQIMISDMQVGFVGKIVTIIPADHIACMTGKGIIALLVPNIESIDALRQMTEGVIKFLRNPAYFQFHEEVFMEFGCGTAVSDEKTAGFNALYEQASHALRSLEG